MIYDCFPFCDELMLLEIRLRELYPVIDKFVLVESTHTQTGIPKRLYYDEVKDSETFAPFKDKITHIVFEMTPKPRAWDNENDQRNAILEGLSDARPDDIIIVSDSDEIIKPDVVHIIKNVFVPGKLHMKLFYYYFNCRAKLDWLYAAFCRFKDYPTGHLLRNTNSDFHKVLVPMAGWHFSYLSTPEKISKRLNAFAHVEFNTDYYKDVDRIRKCMDTSVDLFERPGMNFSVEPLDAPNCVMENMDKYKEFIK